MPFVAAAQAADAHKASKVLHETVTNFCLFLAVRARNYVPYWSQLISAAAQRGAAEEILYRTREEAGAREAARGREP